MSKQKTSLAPIVSTIIVALLAIAVAVFAIVIISNEDSGKPSEGTGSLSADGQFALTQELVNECTYAAHDLVAAHYKAVKLFVTEGLDYLDEPYGNVPEDGYYTVDSAAYTSLEDITALLDSIYTPEEAQRIMTDLDGNGLQVYKNREKLVKVENNNEGTSESTAEADNNSGKVQYVTEYVLGISAEFTPAADYTKDWSSCRIAVTPVSKERCDLVIYLNGLSPETATEADTDSILKMTMAMGEEGWRLTSFAY